MAKGEIKIYGKFRASAGEGILAETKELFDVIQQKDQETINQELYEGAGGGKVKDILVNDETVLDEETGIAEFKIDTSDADVSVEMSGDTVYIGVKGISNGTIVLS